VTPVRSNTRGAAFAATLLALLLGCGGEPASPRGAVLSPLKALLSLYSQATTQSGHRPANEAEFKEFVAQNGGELLKAYKTDAEKAFISPRDNQPFVVVYGQRPAGMAAGVVAYEQTGVDGIRQVGFELGYIEEVDDAKFKEMVPNPPGG
jgi:hypothetical protein